MSDKISVKSMYRTYDVNFIHDFSKSLIDTIKYNKDFVLIDTNILKLYGDTIKTFDSNKIIKIEAKEENKTIDYCLEILKKLLNNRIKKKDLIIAVGGGITQDITGFISSVIFRGIDWKFYPTTLLAQADSCIGSKTSINFENYKNLIGNFYPPQEIYIDVNFLKSLPEDEIKSGIGEMLHYYLINGSEFTDKIMQEYNNVIDSPGLLNNFIYESLRIKKIMIEIDEFDRNERNIFNYGHTFGHAIETVSRYKINHGQAVTMGMDIANFISHRLGHLDRQQFEDIHALLKKNMPEFKLDKDTIESYTEALSKDKKNLDDNLVCILSSGPGLMKKHIISNDQQLQDMILSYFALPV